MSRVLVLTAVTTGLLLVPSAGSANHVPAVPDGLDCANLPAGAHPVTTSEQDRGAACVSDGNAYNGAEYYVGGDAATEEDYPDTPENDTGEACGAVIVGGQVASATRPDDPNTPANEAIDWDWMHSHPDGTQHHHTCN
jgi:hypothetical protein